MAARIGGIILCGGKSTRMGAPKALLPFGRESLLERVLERLNQAVGPIVVVAARDQELPSLPSEIGVVRDRRQDCGPLEGLAAGLAALAGRCDAAYATACDTPFLRPQFVRRVVELLGEHDVAVPCIAEFRHPLAAAYRLSVLPHIDEMLASGQLRLGLLLEHVATRDIAASELTDVDPELESLRNLNLPGDYQAALGEAGDR